MAQSLSNLLIHVVFSTKYRHPFLKDREDRERLHRYMHGVCKKQSCPSLMIGGVEDHVHILCRLSRQASVAHLVGQLKRHSSQWMKSVHPRYATFYWQNGYGAFSVSPSKINHVRRYIERQEEHHRQRTFKEEYRALLDRHGVSYEEAYVWD
jgi:REP element-mobilizing transposase RayT